MIQMLLLISVLGILFSFKYLTWFLDDSYEKEEKIIENILSRKIYKNKALKNKINSNNSYMIKSGISRKLHKQNSGIKFYSFEDDSLENISDKSNTYLNGKCA